MGQFQFGFILPYLQRPIYWSVADKVMLIVNMLFMHESERFSEVYRTRVLSGKYGEFPDKAAKIFEGLHNLILTPHIAGVTQDSNIRVSAMIASDNTLLTARPRRPRTSTT